MQKTNNEIISFLNKYWLSKGIKFEKIIFDLKPDNFLEWKNFLKSKNYYLLNNHFLKQSGFNKNDHLIWIRYLLKSFWKLWISENKAINFFSLKGISLNKIENWILDKCYGIDFEFNLNKEKYWLIVKHGISDQNKFLSYKQLNYFKFYNWNLTNSKILIFDSFTEQLYKFNNKTQTLELFTLNVLFY